MSFYKFQGVIIISQRVMLRPQLLTQLAHVASLEWWVHNSIIHNLSHKQIVAKVVILAFSLHKLFYKKLSLWSFTFTCLLTNLISTTFQILLSFRSLPLLHFFWSLSHSFTKFLFFSLFTLCLSKLRIAASLMFWCHYSPFKAVVRFEKEKERKVFIVCKYVTDPVLIN